MLAERINSTLRFFDLQQLPLTANEIYKFLIADTPSLKAKLNDRYELDGSELSVASSLHFDTILIQLKILTHEKKISYSKGFYCLPGRESLIEDRMTGYINGLKRERLISRYVGFARHIPFVRSIVLLGSQALGQQKPNSDIDLFVITDPKFLGTTRFLLTCYFQILGLRRHGKKTANRFCLNHYLAGSRALIEDRNLYTALEYVKFRPLVYGNVFRDFLGQNQWVYVFFPHVKPMVRASSEAHAKLANASEANSRQSLLQAWLEKIFHTSFGYWLEQKLIAVQLKRIKAGEFTISNNIELSFHPDNRKSGLFQEFFKNESN